MALGVITLSACNVAARASDEVAAGSGETDDTLHVDLSRAYRMTLAGGFAVQSAQAQVERARGGRLSVSETILPSIIPTLRYLEHRDQLQNTEGHFLNVDKQSARSGLSLQLTWRPSEIIFRRAASGAEVRAAEAGATHNRSEALWETARRYVALASAEASVEKAEELLDVLTQTAGQSRARVRLGLGSDLDGLRLQAQVEQQRQAGIRARIEREAAAGRLALAMGESPWHPVVTAGLPHIHADTPPANLAEAVAEALSRRTDLAAARAAASSARHVRNSWAYGRLLPDLGAEVSPGYLGPKFGNQRPTYDASVFVSWTVGPGGWLDPGRLTVANSDVDLADIHVHDTEARIVAQVREAYAASSTATALETAADSSAALAEQVFQLTRERDQRGLAAAYELVQATEAWLRSSSDLIRVRAEAALARLRLELALERREP